MKDDDEKELEGFVKVYDINMENDPNNYLVVSYLGANLETLMKKCGGKFT